MSNTVITNYTDLNGPTTKADSSVVVIVNKDGSLSVDEKALGTLMSNDRSQGAGISVVRIGHDGRPDDATDSDTEDDSVPHVTLSVDSYYDEPNSIIKYDSGAEMLQSLRIETRENSLVGFQNDHCYTPLMPLDETSPQRLHSYSGLTDPIIEIKQQTARPSIPNSKKITILDQQILPKGKKIVINPSDGIVLKSQDVLNKPLQLKKFKTSAETKKNVKGRKSFDDSEDSTTESSSDESALDRDSDSDYKDTKDKPASLKLKRNIQKPRILKQSKKAPKGKYDSKVIGRGKNSNSSLKKNKEKLHKNLNLLEPKESVMSKVDVSEFEQKKEVTKQKFLKKEKKTPSHVTALLSDMSALFSTPDVIRRVSTDNKGQVKLEEKPAETSKSLLKDKQNLKTPTKKNISPVEKAAKNFELIPQIDDASLAQILQDPTGITPIKTQTANFSSANTMNTTSLGGPLSPTLDLLGVLQPEEEGLTEDLLMHVARLVESSDNLKEVIDKQVLGKVDTVKTNVQTQFQPTTSAFVQTPPKTKVVIPRKDPIEIVRKDGRVITLPPIEAPATRASKRKRQMSNTDSPVEASLPVKMATPEPILQSTPVSKQYVNKKITNKKQDGVSTLVQAAEDVNKTPAESQDSWNSEDDPYRLWCICRQPHNNRFMICCDSCEDWFHGKCVNITKAMGQQMEAQGIEWRCPECIKKSRHTKSTGKPSLGSSIKKAAPRKVGEEITPRRFSAENKNQLLTKNSCIVCKKQARNNSIYCSDACILKHAQDSLGPNTPQSKSTESGKTPDVPKSESRVIVFERKTGRCLAGPNAPTAENLKAWLQKNPTFEVVRPGGTLSLTKPNVPGKKITDKVQTTLNFERIPKKAIAVDPPPKAAPVKLQQQQLRLSKDGVKTLPPKSQESKGLQSPKTPTEPRKPGRTSLNRSQSTSEKASNSPTTPRKMEIKSKKGSTDPIRDNVKKSLQEQIALRMAESEGPKFNDEQIKEFVLEIEEELHELFKDVGMKYKAKYRSLMFNIKDRKNLTLWEKICDKSLSPKQLVRMSPEELASQELAEWRDNEAKHQLELIKKSELDLLAANKTYVLKTHKGEEVMEQKTSISTELDPNDVPVEDVVMALNEEAEDGIQPEAVDEAKKKGTSKIEKRSSSRNRNKDQSKSNRKRNKDSKSESRASRSTRRSSNKEKEKRSTRRSSRVRSNSKDRIKGIAESLQMTMKKSEREKRRSGSRTKSKRNSRSKSGSRGRSQKTDRSRSRSKHRSQSRERRSLRHKQISRKRRSDSNEKKRSKSQDNSSNKSKNGNRDVDSIERPKSAMMKEVHPEYDPHEPMITSAFSEEDLRKSGEDIYDDKYNKPVDESALSEYDPDKSFVIDTKSIPLPSASKKRDKASESDQEPSSTVDSSAVTVWNGCINMVDVARFYVAAHEVSGSGADLEEDLSTELDIVGRINPDMVWDYISKMKRAGNKDIIILRLTAANDEEKMQYIALYSYLSSRNRLGVVKVANTTTVKDFYILPLAANASLPSVVLPLDGPGLDDVKTHLLIAIVIRQRKKRAATTAAKDVVPAKVSRGSRTRSYTPPVTRSYTPPPTANPTLYTSPALSTSVKDKIAATLASAEDEEAYSPGSSTSSGSSSLAAIVPPAPPTTVLRTKMEELNRQIEEQKQQIRKMAQADSSVAEEEEAYSPSRPMTPPPVVPLADISLPSNLQEILATIKQRTEAGGNTATADVDMRTFSKS